MGDAEQERERLMQALLGCTRFAQGTSYLPVRDRLQQLTDAAQSPAPDVYGQGGDVGALEREVCDLLGKPAAVFMPSGTMAQQCALRVWSDRTGHRAVAVHGLSHLVLHEEDALEVMHGIRLDQLTRERRPLTADDLVESPGPFGALCVELPLRDAGHLLPTWDDLEALVQVARDRGVPVHLDGARLWESQPFYDRPLSEIAALADSVYVSFYKGLGGIAGAVLAGPQDVVDAARHWQHRHGGMLYGLYPYAVAARAGLQRLDGFASYTVRARELAAALASAPGLRVFPETPHTNTFVLYADVPAAALTEAALSSAEASKEWVLGHVSEADVHGWAWTEMTVGSATMDWPVDELVTAVTALVERARSARA